MWRILGDMYLFRKDRPEPWAAWRFWLFLCLLPVLGALLAILAVAGENALAPLSMGLLAVIISVLGLGPRRWPHRAYAALPTEAAARGRALLVARLLPMACVFIILLLCIPLSIWSRGGISRISISAIFLLSIGGAVCAYYLIDGLPSRLRWWRLPAAATVLSAVFMLQLFENTVAQDAAFSALEPRRDGHSPAALPALAYLMEHAWLLLPTTGVSTFTIAAAWRFAGTLALSWPLRGGVAKQVGVALMQDLGKLAGWQLRGRKRWLWIGVCNVLALAAVMLAHFYTEPAVGWPTLRGGFTAGAYAVWAALVLSMAESTERGRDLGRVRLARALPL